MGIVKARLRASKNQIRDEGRTRAEKEKGSAQRFKYRLAYVVRGSVSIREAARRVGRDVKAVHGDVTALLNAGVLDRTEDGRFVFPFEAVKVEFFLRAA